MENPMANIKKVDCALLAPCGKTLWNKTGCAHYASIIWGNADSTQPDQDLDPLQYGWKDENGHYILDWFPGPAVLDHLFEDVSVSDNTEDDGHTEDIEDTS